LRQIFVAKLKDNMREIAEPPRTLDTLPTKGLIEGPFVFERKGTYYLTYPHVADKIERLEYATADNPLGPFKYAGVILDESATGCWTVHQSMVEYRGEFAAGLLPSTNNFLGLYFTLTGLHALHVLGGIVVNGWLWISGAAMWLVTPGRLLSRVRAASVYWNFVDAIWIIMFVTLYLL
jgi:hypothetical protein